MRNIILNIAMFFFSMMIFSQVSYKGKVVDVNNEPIAFANIILRETNNPTIVSGVITNEEGLFEIKSNIKSPIISISYIGFEDWSKALVDIENTDLGNIVLKESKNELDEVVLISKKKLIEKKSDHFVINLGNKNFIKNATSWQALKKAPLLSVKENRGLSILGKDDVVVYINNRKSNFSGESLTNYLKNLPAENIEKIEIYSSPPARFDAQGNGVINIILKTNPEDGLIGSVTGVFRQSKYNAGKTLLDLNYNKGNWNFYTSSSISEGVTYVSEKSKQYFPNQINTSTHDTDRINPSNLVANTKLGLDYKVSEKHLIGLVLDLGYNNLKIENTTLSNYFSGQNLDSITKTIVEGSNQKSDFNINVNHSYEVDTLGSNLSWNFNYFKYDNNQFTQNNNYINNSNTPSPLGLDNFNSEVIQQISNYNAKVDYYKVFSEKWNINLGAQIFQTNTNNEIQLKRFNNGNYIIDTNISNVFEFKEIVSSAYLSGKYNPSQEWNYSLGLRVENTYQNGNQRTSNLVNTNEYLNFFPSLFIKFAPIQKHIFSLSFNNRIIRPSFWELNPFRNYITPQIYSDGNPFLNPSRVFNTEFSYVLDSKHTFLMNYSVQNDVIGQLSRVLPDNVLNYYRDNYGVYKTFGATYIYNFSFFKEKFESQFMGNANYKKLEASPLYNEPFTRDGLELDLRLYNYYYFLEDKSLEVSLDLYYNKFGPITQSTLSSVFSMDFTVSKAINNWNLSLYMQDILRSDIYKFSLVEDNNYRRTNENYYDSRRIVFSVKYNFGKNTVKRNRRKDTSSPIKNRVN